MLPPSEPADCSRVHVLLLQQHFFFIETTCLSPQKPQIHLRDNTSSPRSLLSFCGVRSSRPDQTSRAQTNAQAEEQMPDVRQEHQHSQSVLARVVIPVIPVQLTSVSDIHNTCVSVLTTQKDILQVWNCGSLVLCSQMSTLLSFYSMPT